MVECPRCHIQVEKVSPVRSDILVKLQEAGSPNPGNVCSSCEKKIYKELASSGSSILANQEKAKEEFRNQLWKSRTALVKRGQFSFRKKTLDEAANYYEKYIKVLELIFEVPEGEKLTPEHFKKNAKTSELTVITSVFWDLVRIYDSHPNLNGKMKSSLNQLSIFIQYTPIYSDIIRRAQIFARTANNGALIKDFIKTAGKDKPKCFIATAAFEYPEADEVLFLRSFRDSYLLKSQTGKIFVRFYYFVSPPIADFISACSWSKPFIRAFLRALITCVNKFCDFPVAKKD